MILWNLILDKKHFLLLIVNGICMLDGRLDCFDWKHVRSWFRNFRNFWTNNLWFSICEIVFILTCRFFFNFKWYFFVHYKRLLRTTHTTYEIFSTFFLATNYFIASQNLRWHSIQIKFERHNVNARNKWRRQQNIADGIDWTTRNDGAPTKIETTPQNIGTAAKMSIEN